MTRSENDPDHEGEAKAVPGSLLRFGGLLAFVAGCVATANLITASDGRLWLVLAAAVTLSGMVAMAIGLRRELMAGRQSLTTPERAKLRFDQWHGLWVLGYVFSFVFAANILPSLENDLMRIALIVVPIVFFAVMVLEFVRMIAKADEHQRAQHLTASSMGAGALVAGVAAWSTLGELVAGGLPQPPGWALIPSFTVLYVAILSVLNRDEA